MHCLKTRLYAQCAHPETRSRANCARSAQVVGAAERTADQSRACHAHSQRRSRACWACTGRDTPKQPDPGRDLKIPSRDTKLTLTRRPRSRHKNPGHDPLETTRCRDINFMSQPPKNPGRDLTPNQTRSRPQIGPIQQRPPSLLFFFFFSNPPVAFLLPSRCSSLNTVIHTTSNIFIKIILFNFLQFYPVKPYKFIFLHLMTK